MVQGDGKCTDEARPGSRLSDILVQVSKLAPSVKLMIADQGCHFFGKLATCFIQG